MIISVCDRVENIVGKGENAGYQHFLLFRNVLKRLLFQTRQKVSLCGSELNKLQFSNHIYFVVYSLTNNKILD